MVAGRGKTTAANRRALPPRQPAPTALGSASGNGRPILRHRRGGAAMSLEARLRKIEALRGRGRAPTDNEFRAAMALIDRHFEAVVLPELSRTTGYGARAVDEQELAAMRAVEDSGELASAEEVRRRYWQARGVDYDEQTREICDEAMERLRALQPKAGGT